MLLAFTSVWLKQNFPVVHTFYLQTKNFFVPFLNGDISLDDAFILEYNSSWLPSMTKFDLFFWTCSAATGTTSSSSTIVFAVKHTFFWPLLRNPFIIRSSVCSSVLGHVGLTIDRNSWGLFRLPVPPLFDFDNEPCSSGRFHCVFPVQNMISNLFTSDTCKVKMHCCPIHFLLPRSRATYGL